MREIVAMLGWLAPLYLVCVYVNLPNEIKLLLFNIFFFGYEHTLNSNRKMGYERMLNSNRKMGYGHTLNSNRKMGYSVRLTVIEKWGMSVCSNPKFGCAFSHGSNS